MTRPGEINGTIGRARELAAVINSLVIAPAVLVYVGAVASGWLPFRPLDSIAHTLEEHDRAMQSTIRDRHAAEQRSTELSNRLVSLLDRIDRRDRLTQCGHIADGDIRRRCLDDH